MPGPGAKITVNCQVISAISQDIFGKEESFVDCGSPYQPGSEKNQIRTLKFIILSNNGVKVQINYPSSDLQVFQTSI